MDFTKENEDDNGGEEAGGEDERFFIEGSSFSESEERHRGGSPPLLLAFSITPGQLLQDTSPDLQEEDGGDSDQYIDDWMILEGEEQEGDSSIQLNLSYRNSISDDDSGDEDQNMKSVKDTWAVSEKDKSFVGQSLLSRYFVRGRPLMCHICNRAGHLAKSCYIHKKCPTCILCGIQGHIQRDCPRRPCPICGLPSHGLRPCENPPTWNQHCERCGMTGHLSDACPDIWRQYHMTIRLEIPPSPQKVHSLKHKRCPAHCYNCSKMGHYGYECTKRRMISGTSPSLPYVCHYDTMEDILQRRTRMQRGSKEVAIAGSLLLSEQQQSEPTGESSEENQPAQWKSKRNQEARSRVSRRKTWPERRRERQEVKRLRREAQARREGGLLLRSRGHSDDEDPLRSAIYGHGQSTPPPQKKMRRDEAGGRRSRKSREAERWKKRGGMKRGDLYTYVDLDSGSKNLLSPKQRVRHRRR
ncbi:zinc finger CCHC domain-containing protein 7-like [Scomber scombrus]|uniref:Zinc finger CCHC domain-containing protein 7 n=1 Tax=Scomber scombrus TaxID=13677 RepID=A0AAV1PQU8_SCOSC|nr:zinc finger CCHC domain-containing protein 7-like [Scomber scombrus]